MQTSRDKYIEDYLSVVQILTKLADPQHLFVEGGRGTGKSTHIQGPRLDRVQNSMPGCLIILGAATYKSIFDNILPGIMEYLLKNYERGIYFEVGKKPAMHFNVPDSIFDWKHTISFASGTVVQLASADRPESFLGKNAAHLVIDEMLKIPQKKFVDHAIPALRADRSKFGMSPYFMGITGTSSTPNFETDEDWWLSYEKNMDQELIDYIIEIALEIDKRKFSLEEAQNSYNQPEIEKLVKFINRWETRINELKKGQTYYLRTSSLSNIKILGIDYIENQIDLQGMDEGKLNNSIFAVRKRKVGERFFGKFGKQHIFDDSYTYNVIDTYSADMTPEHTSRNLKHCVATKPLVAGYDPGPFSSIIFSQKKENATSKEFQVIKDFHVIHPRQHEELAEEIDDFFKYHSRKVIYLHYDRAGNQRDPAWRKYKPLSGGEKDEDAVLLKKALEKKKWIVHLLSIGQGTIAHSTHYRLLNILFGKHDKKIPDVSVCRNECETLISSINHTPLKRHEGEIMIDKSSEKNLPYEQQALYSPQLATAFMYLLFGEFKSLLPQYSGYDGGKIKDTYSA
jgi:hypothetical protein